MIESLVVRIEITRTRSFYSKYILPTVRSITIPGRCNRTPLQSAANAPRRYFFTDLNEVLSALFRSSYKRSRASFLTSYSADPFSLPIAALLLTDSTRETRYRICISEKSSIRRIKFRFICNIEFRKSTEFPFIGRQGRERRETEQGNVNRSRGEWTHR